MSRIHFVFGYNVITSRTSRNPFRDILKWWAFRYSPTLDPRRLELPMTLGSTTIMKWQLGKAEDLKDGSRKNHENLVLQFVVGLGTRTGVVIGLPQAYNQHSMKNLAFCSIKARSLDQRIDILWCSEDFWTAPGGGSRVACFLTFSAFARTEHWSRQATPGKGDTYLSENISVTDSLMKTDLGRKLRRCDAILQRVLRNGFWWWKHVEVWTLACETSIS